MKLLFFCPTWGLENLPLEQALRKIKNAGYDGAEIGATLTNVNKTELLHLCKELDLRLIMQQFAATGTHFEAYKKDYEAHLRYLSSFLPLFVNSQSGRDYYTTEQNIELLQLAASIEKETGVRIVHETHRGKLAYSALLTLGYVEKFPSLQLAADFSHFCAVSESLLEEQEDILHQLIPKVAHIHARVGHSQGAQVTDPRLPEWQTALERHLGWWDAIIAHQREAGSASFTITPEFGPAPYMPAVPFTREPLANQWEINTYMAGLLRERYKQ